MKELWTKMQNSEKFERFIKFAVYFLAVLYVFSLPSWSARAGWNYLSYGIMTLLIVFVGLYTFLYSWFTFRWSMLLLPAFVLSALIGTIGYSHEYRRWLTLVLMMVTFLALYFSFRIASNIRLIFNLVLAGLFGFLIYFIAYYARDLLNYRNFDSLRLGGYFDNVNSVGGYCSLGFGISLYFLLYGKKMSKKMAVLYYVGYAVLLLAFGVAGASTGSRAFLIDVALIVISLFFVRFRKHPLIATAAIAGVIGLGIGIMFLPFMETMRERMISLFMTLFTDNKTEGSATQRAVWQLYGMILGTQRFIFGYGASGFASASGVGTYTHSNFGEMFCDFGIVGLSLFYFIFIHLGYRLFKNRTNESLCLMALIVVMVGVNSFLMVYYYRKWLYLFMAMCAYLAFQTKESAASEQSFVQVREVPDRMI